MCAHHRGNSPSTPRRSLRKSSSDHAKKKVSLLHQNKTGSKSWDRKRKPSVFCETNTQACSPAEHIKQETEFKIKPSSRSKKLYRFKRTFSEGFSESEPEDDWNGKLNKLNKNSTNVQLSKRKISELKKYLKTPKISEVSVPKVVVQDFSKKSTPTPRLNHMKLKAFTAFLEGQSGNKVVDVSEVPKPNAWKRKISAVTKISSVTSKNDTDSNPSPPEDGSPNEVDVSPTKTHTRLNRSKLLAITSFTKLGKQEIDLVEIESDSDQDKEAEANKEQAPKNFKTASPYEKDESLKNDESVLKTTEMTTNHEADPIHDEVTSKIAEEVVEKSLSENLSEDIRLQRSDRNDELEEQPNHPQMVPVPVSSDRDLNQPEAELRNEQFSQADFEKSKNSKTAAMFQRHGKLLEDNKSFSDKNARSNKKDEKSKRKNIFSCCICCKKEN